MPSAMRRTICSGDVDPQTIQLDGLQTSLVLRRLAIDVLMLTADAKSPSAPPTRRQHRSSVGSIEWLVPTVHAQSDDPVPIQRDAPRPSWTSSAFGSSLAWGGFGVGDMGMPGILDALESAGLSRAAAAARIAGYASTLLSYAQFIATYAALEVEVTIDRAPLVRTKKRSPPGERRELIATVKMDPGNVEWLNCFRALLIAVGLDFSVPNGPGQRRARAVVRRRRLR